jgi:tripartite-type tricarboxylate transporter receptor subunit TctC
MGHKSLRLTICFGTRRRAAISLVWWKAAVVALSALSLAAGGAHAQSVDDYPTRPITLIVPFPAGGTLDIVGRIAATQMSKTLGQQVVVENRAGAGGNLGSRQVARSTPDGYSILLSYVGITAINPVMYSNMGYDPDTQLVPIGSIATSPSVLALHPSLPAQNLHEFIAYAKNNPGKVDYASSGIGTGVHVGTEMLADAAGIHIKHIPYKGTAPAVADLLGGHVKVMMVPIPAVIGSIKGGALRAIGVTSPARSPLLPDVPTIAEAAVPGFNADARYGLMAPAGTPAAIIARLNRDLRIALTDESVQKRMNDDGLAPQPDSPEQYRAAIVEEQRLWGGIVRKLGLRAE